MRKLVIALSALAFAGPALAQPYDPYFDADPRYEAPVEQRLPSPGEAAAMGHMMGNVAGALLDTDVSPMVSAIDPYAAPYGRTLGDLATGGDPYARERLQRSLGALGPMLGDFAARTAVIAPALRSVIADAQARMGLALQGLPADGSLPDAIEDPYWDE